MPARLRGDFAKLEKLKKKVAKIGDQSLQRVIVDNLAQEALTLIAENFRRESDPYGVRWRPKRYPDGRSILVRHGRLRNSFTVTDRTPTRFRIGSAVGYAGYHQTGTRLKSGVRMPARPMVPDGRGLPPEWARAFRETIEEILREHFR